MAEFFKWEINSNNEKIMNEVVKPFTMMNMQMRGANPFSQHCKFIAFGLFLCIIEEIIIKNKRNRDECTLHGNPCISYQSAVLSVI